MKNKFIFYLIFAFIILSGLFVYNNLKDTERLYAKHHHGGHHHHEVCTVICKEPDWGTFCSGDFEYDWDLKQCCAVKCFKKHA